MLGKKNDVSYLRYNKSELIVISISVDFAASETSDSVLTLLSIAFECSGTSFFILSRQFGHTFCLSKEKILSNSYPGALCIENNLVQFI